MHKNLHGRVVKRNSRGHLENPWTPHKIRRARTLYVEMGWSIRATAYDLKLAHSTVQRLLEERKWIRTKKDATTKWLTIVEKNRAKIEKWYVKGVQTDDIISRLRLGNRRKLEIWLSTQPFYNKRERNRVAQHKKAAEYIAAKLAVDVNLLTGNEYSNLARKLTGHVYTLWKHAIPDSDKRGPFTMHLDHRYSIFDSAFRWDSRQKRLVRRKKPLPLGLVCHPANMQMITAIANAHKGASSCITLEELKADIKAFEAVHGKVFK